jgi:HPt (histidine-containing phosphotransfer) domain-containing protein
MLNRSRIDELREEVGEDGFAEVLDLFCEEVEEVLAGLPEVPAPELPERLHFLKGSAINIGMEQVGDLCRTAEERIRADPASKPDLAAIRSAYDRSRKALAAFLCPPLVPGAQNP